MTQVFNAPSDSISSLEEEKMAKFLPRKGKEYEPYDDPNLLIVDIFHQIAGAAFQGKIDQPFIGQRYMKAMKKIFDFEGMIESGAQARKINAVGMTMKGQIDEILTNRSLDFEGIHFVPKGGVHRSIKNGKSWVQANKHSSPTKYPSAASASSPPPPSSSPLSPRKWGPYDSVNLLIADILGQIAADYFADAFGNKKFQATALKKAQKVIREYPHPIVDGAWAAKTLTGVGGSVGGMIDAIVKHKKYTSTDGTKVYEPKGDLKLPEKFSNPEDVDKAAVAKRKREAKKALLAEDEGDMPKKKKKGKKEEEGEADGAADQVVKDEQVSSSAAKKPKIKKEKIVAKKETKTLSDNTKATAVKKETEDELSDY